MATDRARSVLRVDPDTLDLSVLDPRATPVGPVTKDGAAARMTGLAARIEPLQEALYAENDRRVLLVLQGMDTAGKGGTVRHIARLVNPLGLHIAAFKRPTAAERVHPWLWRVRRQVPGPGRIGVFDRSHYEDVLVPRVERLVPPFVWRARYDEINRFEAELADEGVTVIKCLLHISPGEQRDRLLARLDNPDKLWKYHPADREARARWGAYQRAYTDALTHCSAAAPWYVIPSDRKWYRNWAVTAILVDTLVDLAPRFPTPDFDPTIERHRLRTADPLTR